MNRQWSIPFGILALLAAGCLAVGEQAPAVTGGPIDLGDTAWLLTATGLVLLMTPGLSFFYGGMVSKKNVISTMLQSFIALGVISLLWIVVGFSLCFGNSLNGLIGDPRTYFMFRGVRGSDAPRPGAHDSARRLRSVPAEVRGDHAGAHHGVVRRACALLGLSPLHLLVQPVHL